MMRKRRLHFGIDYGTSNSKIVLRDFGAAGGERAHVLLGNDSERFSSSLALVGNEILFGFWRTNRHRILEKAVWYESLKMRAAGEVRGEEHRYYHGPLVPMPTGVTARDFVTLTIWWLITEARRAAGNLVHLRQGEAIAAGMTIGIPMSFYRNGCLRAAFLEVARAAWFLFRHFAPPEGSRLGLDKAMRYLADAYEAVRADPIPDEEVRFWVRSEAEAALWWAFRSPQVPEGPYVKVDIGAGTTNASVFRIVGGRPSGAAGGPPVKLTMAFFGADSTPVGMDAVDEGLARWRGLDPSRVSALRGREDSLLRDPAAAAACAPLFTGMHQALCEAWRQNGRLNIGVPVERQAWLKECKAFLLGGGSLARMVRERLAAMPFNPDKRLPVMKLDGPPDLRLNGRQVPGSVLPFVLVAYGLSILAPPIPMVETPDEIPPMPPSIPTVLELNHEDLYLR